MSEYCFFTHEAQSLAEKVGIKDSIELFAEKGKKQTYVICRPLSKENSEYDYSGAIVVFASGSKPCFIDIDINTESFEEYMDDFFDDLSFLSEKFKYKEKIGRKKHWTGLFHQCSYDEIDFDALLISKSSQKRIADLITSLVIGSINNVSKIDINASNVLDAIKSKIILFDTDQTTFVFKSGHGKKYAIQGLAGSGKTELLLHKLKEIYSEDHEARIAFTCYNKILASSMRKRIPDFFDFMRVERQIYWDEKLFCFHAWGSRDFPYSGMYRYICHKYNIAYGSLSAGPFETLCKKAIDDIKKSSPQGTHQHIFDYVFIDESQDFGESFIDLCELVTEKKVFIAGDVFQNIFRPIQNSVSKADLVLKKCYRTDPRNLMFSHALGMGLYETPVLRWLKNHEWDACGYNYQEKNGRAIVSRDPLRRFEDIPDTLKPTSIHYTPPEEEIADSILQVVNDIKSRHLTIEQGDIAILFLDKSNYIYNVIPKIKEAIKKNFGWDANVSFETKTSDSSKLFISNINNAKGLEFPFVICFAMNLNRNPSFRNALYTMMARSFLESHLVIGNTIDSQLRKNLDQGLKCITEKNMMDIRVPSSSEIADQESLILLEERIHLEDYVRAFCTEKKASPRLTSKLVSRILAMVDDDDFDETYINSILEAEYKRNVRI